MKETASQRAQQRATTYYTGHLHFSRDNSGFALCGSSECAKLLKGMWFGRGDRIRTCDFLRPRHRNMRCEKPRKPRILNALAPHRLPPRLGDVVKFVAVDYLRTQHLARTSNRPVHDKITVTILYG